MTRENEKSADIRESSFGSTFALTRSMNSVERANAAICFQSNDRQLTCWSNRINKLMCSVQQMQEWRRSAHSFNDIHPCKGSLRVREEKVKKRGSIVALSVKSRQNVRITTHTDPARYMYRSYTYIYAAERTSNRLTGRIRNAVLTFARNFYFK